MDLDDYLNLQSHSEGSTHELHDLLSPTHDTNGSAASETNNSTVDVAKGMAPSDTTTAATVAAAAAITENEQTSLAANYPLFSTSTPTSWNEQMALATSENDTARLFDKPLTDVEQFLYTFGGGNAGIPAASNWNILDQHQHQHGLSMTPTPLTDLAGLSSGLPDFLAPHFLTLTDMEKTVAENANNNSNSVMVQQLNNPSFSTTEADSSDMTGMVTRSKRQRRTTDRTTVTSPPVVSTVQPNDNTLVPNADAPTVKKKRGKKLYCICQKPYDGQPMVQCDGCKQWFHCSCMNLNADEMDNVDWMCDSCKTDANTALPIDQPAEPTVVQNKVSIRQSRHRHTCLLASCNQHTRANSYCSDVCAHLDTATTHLQDGSLKPKSKKRSRSITSVDSSGTDSTKNDLDDQTTNAMETTTTPPTKETSNAATMDPTRKNVLKPLTTTLTPLLTDMADQLPEALEQQVSSDPLEAAESLAILIESAIFEHLGDQGGTDKQCGSRYKNKVRSLLYNLRDKANREFQLRVVRGDLTPDELAQMSSEDMANPALKSMSESLREKSIKDSVLKIEHMPIIKKTHKGDIIMTPRKDNNIHNHSHHDSPTSSSLSSIPQLSSTSNTVFAKESNSTHNLPDALKKVSGTSSVTSPPSSASSSTNASSTVSAPDTAAMAHTPLAMTKDKMDAIWKQIGITRNNDGTPQHKEQDTSKPKKTSVDLEALLGAEDDYEQLYAGDEDDNDTDKLIVWNGRVDMPEVASFDATARQIGGRVLTKDEWQQVLPSSLYIEGRIRVSAATKYVSSMRQSSSRELVVLEIKCQTTSASNERHMQTLINYFDSLERYGVVAHDKMKIKDFYLLPLSKAQRVPDALYVVPVEERQRDADMFLGVLVISKKQQQQQQQQQQYQHHGPSANNSSHGSYSKISYPQHTPYYPTYHPS